MPNKHEQFSIAVLDDYQGVALSMADWSVLEGRASTATRNASIDVKASSIRSRCRLIISSGACRTCSVTSAHWLRFARPLRALLSGHGRQHSQMAR